MAKAEFGIIEDIMETREYSYNPEKYHCVSIEDVYKRQPMRTWIRGSIKP